MLDTTATMLALRNRAIGLEVPTTGTTSLSATSTGYARAAGSFITDGFAVGMEVLAAGFGTAANNGRSVITGLTATAMTVTKITEQAVAAGDPTRTIVAGTATTTEAAGGDESIVAGLPVLRGFEGIRIAPNPIAPYVVEEFVPGPSQMLTMPYSGGVAEETGIYVLKWYGIAGKGVSGIWKCVDALVARFTPGTTLTAGSETIRIRGDIRPRSTQLLAQEGGWLVCPVEIPWRATTTNTVAA